MLIWTIKRWKHKLRSPQDADERPCPHQHLPNPMFMRQTLLPLLAFLWLASGLHAQSEQELSAWLKRDLEAYRKHTLTANFDSSLRYMPPRMFEIVPFDSLKETVVMSMNNEYMTIEMPQFDYDSDITPKIQLAYPYYWAVTTYTGTLRMIIKAEPSIRTMLVPVLQAQFGDKDMKVENDSTVQITFRNRNIIAYKDPALPHWCLIEDKRSEKGPEGRQQTVLLQAIIPEAVLNAVDER
jgi:hypothetical protein